MSHSSLMGLATLRAMAKESVSYESAMTNSKPTLLEFYADWCTTCQGMAPIVRNLEQEYRDDINVVMLNIDDPKWAKIIATYHVTGVPQFMFLDAHHTVTKTWVGKVPEPVMTHFFANLAS
ncbi:MULTISPECIES: thioredoxin domain-containing protein [unclassified Coleofasciculus]|uniref:thioredoxin domain-containing protein n=1 Tax=unclassified Coleofasciculus TaxID=2692782 RepID=UPI00187EE41D|nr:MULTISPECIES: thioredoxin domain-containing protein [unclassified Coleofasciculus]MBE9128655.1 redoxin family protein [Coleofasciculus sp. LEGE 07081]MBE9149750.1 redoxin family protein [Coleofasciculus sp. LEGE 07092]